MSKQLSTKELAQKLGVSQRTVQRRIAAGEIPAEKVGRGLKVTALTTREYAEQRGISVEKARREIRSGQGAKSGGRGLAIPLPAPEPEPKPRPGPGRDYSPEPIYDEEEEPEELEEDMYYGEDARIMIAAGTHSPSEYDHTHQRKYISSFEEAISYAEDIPVPTIIITTPSGAYMVIVNYP